MRSKRRYAGRVALALSLAAATPAAAAMLPDNVRLDPVRPALERTVDQVAREGLPPDLIVSKVREGLAKGASPEAIRVAVERLARSLGDAEQFLRLHRKRPGSLALVRALAEARTAGVDLEVVTALIESEIPDSALVRGIEVLTDLALRGYPSHRAAAVVEEVVAHDPTSVGHVVAGVESIRVGQAVSRADALDALDRNLGASGGSFDAALARAVESAEHGGGKAGGRDRLAGASAANTAGGAATARKSGESGGVAKK
jgi:hypothetical protein